ncbi:MAG TPA: hypothetical protein VGZ90_03715 [Puia sp.]|jgi:hypothetical protein|nr:hypothetical protein [Puia sp.]
MKKKIHIAKSNAGFRILFFLFLEFILIAPAAFSQNTLVAKDLSNDYNQYRSQYVQEKLYVHTDKDSYISREICWFRIYYVDAFFNSPASLSKIAYVEILDRNNRTMLQQKVSLKPGESNGSMIIPINIPSGSYKFRAYTSWMKNFGPEYFFEKAIRIINTKNLQADSTLRKIKKYDVQFFPEGGNLVQQVESKVAFRITDAYGRGLEYEGLLMNLNGDTILRFQPSHKGLGNFVFTPAAGQSYKALVRFPQGESITKDLPSAYTSGYVISLSKNQSSKIVLNVHVSDDMEDQDIYLVIHGQRSILPAKSGRLTGHSFSFIVDTGELEDGISQFTVFNRDGQPVCERLYFKYPEKKLLISTSTNPEYGIREKISLNLSVKDQLGNPASADMSLAVYRLDSLQEVDETNIRNYLYLSSELGTIESPGFYFEENGKSREQDMENLMLTHGWRRFNWKDIIQHKSLLVEFSPEFDGHIITGKLVNNRTGVGVPYEGVYLSVPSTRTQYRPTLSDGVGRVKFEVTGFYGTQELVVQTNPKEDSASHIEISSPFSQKYSPGFLLDFPIPTINSPTLLYQSIHEQVRHIYDGTRLSKFDMQNVDSNTFYVVPDEKYLLDDYTRFQTMEEVLREYVRSMKVNRRGENFQIYLVNNPVKRFFPDEPLILIDGVPFFYTNELIQQDPLKIKRLDLINRQYAIGYQTYPGIINLITYQGDLDGIVLDPHALVLDYPGIPEAREFYSPKYETEQEINSRMPDYRTLLYWTPQIKSGSDGEKPLSFYTSDIPGKYALVVQGLTDSGVPGSQVLFFNVKK